MMAAMFFIGASGQGLCADASDPIIDLFLQKGFITEREAAKAKSEIATLRTNEVHQLPPMPSSKWQFGEKIKQVELFGDVRVRYEDRSVGTAGNGTLDLQRSRYAVRMGLRGEVADDFYYGVRFDTSANPRSSWVTFGSSATATPFQGPFGKSTATVAVGQAYLSWHPKDWVNLTAGKMPNPLFTTPLVWDPDLNPEGLAERFKYTVGSAEFFATFGQFLYQDVNPATASSGLGFNGLVGQSSDNIFQLTWQTGLKYQFTTNISAKVAASVYQYVGLHRSSVANPGGFAPYFGDPFVGEGSYLGPGTGTTLGFSGYNTPFALLPGFGSVGYPLNQVGLNDLTVVELPFEVTFKFDKVDARFFGDVAYNLEGDRRAEAASQAYANFLANQAIVPTVAAFPAQYSENMAWQLGAAVGNPRGWDAHVRHPWEFKTYWQHTEQYALDVNLIDSDAFEGRGNLEGFNVQLSYGLTPNFIGTVRYAQAWRINKAIGTGGSNPDIPQVNAIDKYQMLQLDLAFHF